jgi:hypothetical protein
MMDFLFQENGGKDTEISLLQIHSVQLKLQRPLFWTKFLYWVSQIRLKVKMISTMLRSHLTRN